MFSTGNISPNSSVTIDSTPPRPRDPYEAFLCDDLHRALYGTSSHVEAISHPATLRGQRQDVYSKTVKSSCSPATQGSTITGRCRRFEGRVRSQSLELTRGEGNHPCFSYSYRTNAASIMDNRVRPVALSYSKKVFLPGTNMRERCSRYSFILDISSLDVLTLNSNSTQVLLVLVLSIRFPRPVLLHSG